MCYNGCMAKQPTCRNCKGTGTVHIECFAVSQPVDMRCWVCNGTNFKGMNKEQVDWYLAQHKSLGNLIDTVLANQKVIDTEAYNRTRAAIDKACSRLGIKQQPIARQTSIQYGKTSNFLTLRTELKEYERRLTTIPSR